MKLFRMLIKNDDRLYPKKYNYYVVSDTKQKAEEYINSTMRSGFMIDKVYYLGDSMTFGDKMFTGKKKTGGSTGSPLQVEGE